MSSASTLGIPLQQAQFASPLNFASGGVFNYTLENAITLQPGNYLVWIYFYIEGDTDTELNQFQYYILNNINYFNTLVQQPLQLNDNILPLQTTQILSISEPTNLVLRSIINYDQTQPNITGTIVFSPL
jgi:hypothetical protein